MINQISGYGIIISLVAVDIQMPFGDVYKLSDNTTLTSFGSCKLYRLNAIL